MSEENNDFDENMYFFGIRNPTKEQLLQYLCPDSPRQIYTTVHASADFEYIHEIAQSFGDPIDIPNAPRITVDGVEKPLRHDYKIRGSLPEYGKFDLLTITNSIIYDVIDKRPITLIEYLSLRGPLWYRVKNGTHCISFFFDTEHSIDMPFSLFDFPAEWIPEIGEALNARNERLGWVKPFDTAAPRETYSTKNDAVDMPTTQEFSTLQLSISDGKSGNNWKTDINAQSRTYRRDDATHLVKINAVTDEESINDLATLTSHQDTDGAIAAYVIANALMQEAKRDPIQNITGLHFDLVDVAKKIGFDPRNAKETQALRQKVYAWFIFLTRAMVIGRRTTPYYDKTTGKEINTQIEAPMLMITSTERPVQTAMFGEAPVTVTVALTPPWRERLLDQNLAQYLPFGERIAEIKPKQPGGAWARSIGLSLMTFWRRNIGKNHKPTRRELLTLTPTRAPSYEILSSDNPKRAAEYWHSALRELVTQGIVADMGEAQQNASAQLANAPRYDWQEPWLNEHVDIQPARDVREALDTIAANKYLPRPKDLTNTKNKGGRPRKQRTE